MQTGPDVLTLGDQQLVGVCSLDITCFLEVLGSQNHLMQLSKNLCPLQVVR